jgi:glycosyltransferase involved in cell wall biosynthesis
MKALFVHQNSPGQFKHLAPRLAGLPQNRVDFITQNAVPLAPGVRWHRYAPSRKVTPGVHPYLASSEAAVLNGQAVARVALRLRQQGYRPDVILGHHGWGETMFLKDIWPEVPLVLFAEFYYRGQGADLGFDPEFDGGLDAVLRARARAGVHLLALEAADAAYSPTHWQKSTFPAAYHDRISVIHDGVDVDRLRPDPAARLTLPDGRILTREDEVLTYVARNLEPYRGFHSFMRALPEVLRRRPEAQVVIVGGDGVSYGRPPGDGCTWRETLLAEIGPLPDRVVFAGRLAYPDFLRLLQVSSVHCYLTYPFVLGWSALEAMAAGGFVVASDTAPVTEVIEDGRNGWLVDFHDTQALAARLSEALAARHWADPIRAAARETVVARYALADCLAAQYALLERARGGAPALMQPVPRAQALR